ncbi:glycosyltransferase [Nocardioides salsibiostraticola]
MSQSDPRVSALVTTHAGLAVEDLRDALESLAAQTRPVDEVVLVEDGPMGSRHRFVLSNFADNTPNVIRIGLSRNGGAGVASQAGLEACSNEWVAKVDGDDINHPNRIEAQLAIVAQGEVDVCGAAMAEFEGDPDNIILIRRNPSSHEHIARRMSWNNPINHPTAFFSRRMALAVGGYSDMRYMQDYDLFARMIVGGARMINLEQALVSFRTSSSMLSRRRSVEIKNLERRMQRNLLNYGVINSRQLVRNRIIRGGFRCLPEAAMRNVYRAMAFQTRVDVYEGVNDARSD